MKNKQYRVRFKRDGQPYKTATRDDKEDLDYNTAAEVMNNIRDKQIACWMFALDEQGNPIKPPVAKYMPSRTEEF